MNSIVGFRAGFDFALRSFRRDYAGRGNRGGAGPRWAKFNSNIRAVMIPNLTIHYMQVARLYLRFSTDEQDLARQAEIEHGVIGGLAAHSTQWHYTFQSGGKMIDLNALLAGLELG